MLKGYHINLRAHALRVAVLERPPDLPDMVLGIGAAEMLAPAPLKYSYRQEVRTPVMRIARNMDDTNEAGMGRQFSPEEFPKEGYMGEAY